MYYIHAEDVSGLGGVEITYQFETGDLIRFQGDILSRKGNEYTVAVNIGQYEKGGNYTLSAVTLADASGRANLAVYNNNHNGYLTDIYTVRSIPYSGEIELHLTEQNPPAARIGISEEDALGKIEQAAEKS